MLPDRAIDAARRAIQRDSALALAGLFLAAACLILPDNASAQPFRGVYIGAGAGYNLPDNIGVQTPVPLSPSANLRTNGGIAALGSVGYGFGNGLRLEVEGNFRNTPVSQVTGGISAPASGSLRTYGVMANALFDMDIGFPWLYPFVGGGVGYAWTNSGQLTVAAPGAANLSAQADGTQGRFAVQAIAGLSFPMPGVPGLSLSTEYRFLGALGNATYDISATPGGGRSTLTIRDQYNHSFLLGVRYAFNIRPPVVPATAPSPAPAPVAEARTYLVFFDWDSATLSNRARSIIRDAAANAARVQTTRIEVSGHADLSGKRPYNQRLSARRAEVVAAELVKEGVQKDAITIRAFGDSKPLVPTGPGVREPQNRRVEIILN